jgi:ethanolamine utilization microcompartment shell protein EutS/uncharacterized SAM-dependent methyltransferase
MSRIVFYNGKDYLARQVNFVIDTSGNVGVGTTNPSNVLDVSGNANISEGNALKIGGTTVLSASALGSGVLASSLTSVGTLSSLAVSGDLTVDTNTFKVDSNTNKVGIMTTSPSEALDVSGNANLSVGNVFKIAGNNVLSATALGSGVTSSSLTSVGTLSSLTVSGDVTIDSSTLKVDSTNNRVGIMTTAPSEALDVSGNANLTTGNVFKIAGAEVLSATALGSGVTASSLTSVGTLSSLTVAGDVTIDSSTLKVDSTNNRVGIMTTAPSEALDVSGNANLTTGNVFKIAGAEVLSATSLGSGVTASSLTSVGTLTSLTVAGDVTIDSSTLKVDSSNNRVGIMTTSPSEALDVSGNANLTVGNVYKIAGNNVLSATALGSGVLASSLTSVGTLTSLAVSGNLTVDDNTFKVDSSSNKVGILTSTPNHALDVAGSANLSVTNTYKIANTDVLSATTLGSGVTSSSLTSVGTLTGLTVSNTISAQGIDNSGNTLNIGTNASTLNLGNGDGVQTVNIGPGLGATTINIGGTGDTVNIAGSLNYIQSQNLQVDDKQIIINKNATGTGTARNAGIFIRDNNSDTQGYINVDGSGTGFELKAPENSFILATPSLTSNSTVAVIDISNQLLTPAGTASVPVLSTTSDKNTGIYYPVADNFAITTGGSERMRVDASGNLGVGTTQPAYKLDVSGVSAATSGDNYVNMDANKAYGSAVSIKSNRNYEIISTNNSSDAGGDKLTIRDGAAGQYRTVLADSVGRMGIGLTSPSELLDVSGNTNLTTGYVYKIGGTEVLSSTTLGYGVVNSSLTSVGTLTSLTIAGDLTVDTNTFKVDSSNNRVGVNMTNPTHSFTVKSSDSILTSVRKTSDTGDALLEVGQDSTNNAIYLGWEASKVTLGRRGVAKILTYDASGTNLVGGNVGINNANPQFLLDVSGNANLSSGYTYKIAGADVLSATTLGSGVVNSSLTSVGTLTSLTVAGDVTIDSDTLKVDSSNNRVGILNSSPSYVLDVSGTANLSSGYTYKIAGNDVLSATTLGSGVVNSSLTSVGTLTSLTVAGDVTIDSNTLKVDSSNNRVGILNSSPSYVLDVSGTANLSSGYTYKIAGNDVLSATTLGSGVLASSLTSVGTLTSLTVAGDVTIDSDTLKVDSSNNRVGILNSSPSYVLDVSGTANLSSGYTYKIAGNDVLSATTLGSGVVNSSLTSVGTLTSLTVAGDVTIDSNTLKVDSSNNRVGILNSSPSYVLDVSGTANLSSGYTYKIAGNDVLSATTLGSGVVNSSLTSVGTLTSLTVAGDVTIDSNTLKVDSSNNRVGILNSSPSYVLDVSGTANLSSGYTYKIAGNDVLSATTLGSGVLASSLTSVGTLTSLTVAGDLLVDTNTFKVDSSSNKVGILNTSPAYALDVAGSANLSVTNTYKINGADVLSATTLGSGVVNSSLTNVGTLTALTVSNTISAQGIDNSGNTLNVGTNASTLNLGNGDGVQTVNIGPGLGATTINIGGTGDTVNIAGSLNYIQSQNLQVDDKQIIINKNAVGSGTARNAGIFIRDNNSDTQGYINVSNLGSGFELKAPENNFILATPILASNSTVAVIDASDQLLTPAGSATVPVLSTSNDKNTGIYYPVADNFAITTGGSEKLRLDASGNLGLGNTQPIHLLDVSGNTNLSSGYAYKIANSDVLSATTLGSGVVNSSLTSVGTLTSLTIAGDLTVDTNTFKVDSSNNRVGVNMTNPTHSFTVKSSDSILTSVRKTSDTGDALLEVGQDSTNNAIYLGWEASKVTLGRRGVAKILTYDASGTNLVGGNVGIGNANPQFLLDVSGQGRVKDFLTIGKGSTDSLLRLERNETDAESFNVWYDTSNNILNTVFRNGGGADFTLSTHTAAGNFGINATNPTYKLEVGGNAGIKSGSNVIDMDSNRSYGASIIMNPAGLSGARSYNLISTAGNAGSGNGKLAIYDDTAALYRTILCDASGNMGIGTTNPTNALQVVGTMKSTQIKDYNNSTGSLNQIMAATGAGYEWLSYSPYQFNVSSKSMFPENNTNITDISGLTGSAKWFGGVLAQNGKIYCVPYSSTYVLIINPFTNTYDTTSITGLTGNNKWAGGVLAPNGKIYCIPHDSSVVLIIDTVNNTADTATITGLGAGTGKWVGGVLAPNGKIYGIPRNSSTVLIIDPDTNTADTATITGLGAGTDKWLGGVLASNGKIYCAPGSATTLLIIDPSANTADTTTITGLSASSLKWSNGCISENGTIYFMPLNATSVLAVDYASNTVTELNADASGWYGACTSPNGKIYAVPHGNTNVMTIDSVQNIVTASTISGLAADASKWVGCVVAQNGKIYCIPYNSTYVLVIKTGLPNINHWILNPEFNKY